MKNWQRQTTVIHKQSWNEEYPIKKENPCVRTHWYSILGTGIDDGLESAVQLWQINIELSGYPNHSFLSAIRQDRFNLILLQW